jgi:uracil-DNA glycosylase
MQQNPIRLYLEQLHALGMDSIYLSDKAQQMLSPPGKKEALDQLDQSLKDCKLCRLCEKRKQMVFGGGNPEAQIVFVGEGPGADEDQQGIPFVGRAGQLLTDMIEKGMNIKRKDIYICNVIKCRPPGNRNPQVDEIAACEPFLIQQLDIIQPKVIVALGKFAAQTLLQIDTGIMRMRGKWHEFRGIKVMPTFHPSYILHINDAQKQREEKIKIWNDLKMVLEEIG